MPRRGLVVDHEASVCKFIHGVLVANGQEVPASHCLPTEKFSVGRFLEFLLPLISRESERELSIHAPQTV